MLAIGMHASRFAARSGVDDFVLFLSPAYDGLAISTPQGISLGEELGISWSYYTKAIQLIIRYPASVSKLLAGYSAVQAYIDKRLHEDYMANPVEIKHVRGFDICLNPKDLYISSYIAKASSYELTTTPVFASLLRQGDVVVDVGANVGWFTLLAAKITGKGGRVVSFEPEPTNFSLLSKSICLNGFKNVVALERCALDYDGEVTLHLTTAINMPGSHSTVRDFGQGSITVPVSRLDSTLGTLGINRIRLLKVDAEGSEPQVIAGAMPLIEASKVQNMLLEWNPEAWQERGELLNKVFDSFDVYEIGPPMPSPLKKIERDRLPSNRPNLYLRLRKDHGAGNLG